ncbi:hypothetical protein CP083_06040 [Candidatus Bathyarchaeota archaeon B24-2]|nr:MAG: hypothetical protein CP083_06040 [Candidatus Bathyarchaeota archaeon B24-2]
MNLKEARELALTFRELSSSYKVFGKALKGNIEVADSLKRLIGSSGMRDSGSKLISTGMALIALPVPMTEVVGAGLIAAGLLKRRSQTTISDFYREFRRLTRELEDLIDEIVELNE